MGMFGSMFGQQRIRHEAGEAGDGQEYTAIDGIDLENNTVTLRSLRRPDAHDEPGATDDADGRDAARD